MPTPVAEALPGQHILLSFLATQSQISLTRLYSKPSACLSLFRLLNALERQIIMNYLWLEGPVSSNTMSVWITREGQAPYKSAMETLASLQVLPAAKPGSNMLQLSPSFKKNFRLALTGGGDHMSFGAPCEKDPAGGVTVEMLDRYAANCWESILHFMVSSGTDGRASRPTKGILYLLDRSGLMAGQGAPKITSQGFQFLLTSPHAQLWTLLLQYLTITNERNIDMVEVIQFLFMLSTMQLGQEYSTEPFSTTYQSVLEDLIDYGLVYKRQPNRIYPTRLATTLTSGSSTTASSSAISSQTQTGATTSNSGTVATAGGGFIILETNYRLYAYTENPLQIAILNLFVSLRGRFSNLVTGSITRESVRKALDNGITADQIISYLVTHAHPQMHKNNPLIPITVQDQIRLWEQEKNRVQIAEGYLWKEFTASTDYNLVLDHAKSTSSVVWENEQARMFFVTPDGHIELEMLLVQQLP
ncbi:RNA polymerase II transcription factor B 52 kDa subunit [Tulasnella sp. 417]|nr:RNA polymerase II transcription factor B 52 kDa subunit [Tulasnella sp. 417]